MGTQNVKKKKILVAVLLCLVMIFLFQEAYAKYRKFATAEVDNNVASWEIKINNELIGNKTTLTNHITPVITASNYVKPDVLAPGSTGYFDVNIDATNADVTFTYEIDISAYDTNTIADLNIYAYSVNDFSTTTSVTNGDSITGTIQHNTASTNLRIYFNWLDDGTDTMSNQDDTSAALDSTANADILVNFHMTQTRN